MKTQTTLLAILLVFFAMSVQAQTLSMSTYVEQTKVSPKLGTRVGIEFVNQIGLGGFYQKSAIALEAEYGRPMTSENVFYGMYFGYPLMNRGAMDLKLNIRTGVTNGENFTITPSVQSSFRLLQKVSLEAGVGVRSFRPTAMAGLRINL